MDSLFQIVVQVFIRVQFGSIGRKIKDSDLALMCFKPLGYLLAVVDSEVIEDEIDFPFYVFHESGPSGQTQVFKQFMFTCSFLCLCPFLYRCLY